MGDWYTRFDRGSHKRMGDLTFQDATWSPEVLVEVMKQFESDWAMLKVGTMSDAARRKRERDIILPTLMGELQGEELPLMDPAGTRNNTQTGLGNPWMKHGVVHCWVDSRMKSKKNIT
jgi:hypothetical protein